MSKQHFVIVCIINDGFADEAMDAARAVGARGGTVLSARGTANIEAEKAFHIQIHTAKSGVIILVDDAIKDDVLRALYRSVGTHTPAHGIAFSMPVDGVVGIGSSNPEEE